MQLRSACIALASIVMSASIPACVTQPDSSSGESASSLHHKDLDAGHSDAATVTTSDPRVVATDKGFVQGVPAGSGVAFLGIPYAQPPLGALRFMPPVPAAPWSGVASATAFGQTCVQIGGDVVTGSEDCLSLNVWTPALPNASSKPLPVLFWVYGGADMVGATDKVSKAGVNLYDGQALATSANAVVVTVNYRIGALGFLAHPALAAASPDHTTGNAGLLDVLMALHWVQDNIASFGGDKTHVMLFGQSAGAINTCSLVASPLAHGLFSSALMESGNCAAEPRADRYAIGEKFANALACDLVPDVVRCLQNAPLPAVVLNGGFGFVRTLVAEFSKAVDPGHIPDLPFGPTVDGYVLDDTPQATIAAGKHNHVPLVIGTNADEMTFLIPSFAISSCLEYETIVLHMMPNDAPRMFAAYPCNKLDQKSGEHQFVKSMTDAFFTCPSRRALRAAHASQSEPVYRYLFTHTYTSGPKASDGAYHTAEIPFVFGNFGWIPYTPTSDETALSRQMQMFWLNFAATGMPGASAGVAWNAYDPTADDALRLDTPLGTTSAIDATGCAFWDSVQ
jgi:para-nitrobenzyl esterase